MNRQQAKDLLPIIQAFAEGKTIESRFIESDDKSFFDNINPSFSDEFEYRIKPESKYRPFKNREEAWPEMLKHQPFGWIKEAGDKYNIVFIGRNGIIVNNGVGNGYRNFKDAFNLTFDDDTPFGIKE